MKDNDITREEILKNIRVLKYHNKDDIDTTDDCMFRINERNKKIKELEQQLKEMEKKPPVVLWKPEIGDIYFFTNIFGYITYRYWKNNNNDYIAYKLGNISPTEKLAELKRDIDLRIQSYQRKVAEFNGDWEADWKDSEQYKYYLQHNGWYIIDTAYVYKLYEAEKEGFYFSIEVSNSDEQLLELKKLYKKIIELTQEYKEEEKKWREGVDDSEKL